MTRVHDGKSSEYQRALLKWLYKTVVILLVFFVMTKPLVAWADNGDTIVHVTRTGSCYHSEGCGYLHSDIEISLADAVEQGYTPCSRCNPPIYDGKDKEETKKTVVAKNKKETKKPAVTKSKKETKKTVTKSKVEEKKQNNAPETLTTVKKVVYVKENNKENDVPYLPWICGTIVVVYLIYKVSKVYIELRKEKIRQHEATIEYERKRQFFLDLYFGKDPLSLVDVPEGVILKDDLPCTVDFDRSIYGDYTVYVGQNAEVLHFNCNCGGGKLRPINYYEARNLRHCKRCAVGRQNLPKLDWYIKYLEIKKIKEEYNIP